MRILLLHPDDHSGGAEIAGNWPPAWAAYVAGAIRATGLAEVRFIDAMTDRIPVDRLEPMVRAWRPDVVMTTAITPAIHEAEAQLRMVKGIDPRKFVDEIETLVRDHQVGFFILADEEPTINRKKFVALCEELVARQLPVHWGLNTRVTDILRDEALVPLYRGAGLVHVSLGTEAAAQLNLERFRKETTIAQNKKAIKPLQEHGIVAEAQFIVGMENETPETLEETYRMARDRDADMVDWNCYTPWPFSDLFRELGDKVEVHDFSKYDFVTPIIEPEAMTRGDVLRGVMRNDRRYHVRKSLVSYPWQKDPFRRKYLRGCLKAFLKSSMQRRFYDLGRVGFWGQQGEFDRGFDESRTIVDAQQAQLAFVRRPRAGPRRGDPPPRGIAACGGTEGGADVSGLEGTAHDGAIAAPPPSAPGVPSSRALPVRERDTPPV